MFDDNQLRAAVEFGGERRSVEFKRSGSTSDKEYVAKVARAGLALANYRGGGSVLLGVDDRDPLTGENGLTSEQLAEWTNLDLVSAKINAYADPALEITLVALTHPSGLHVVALRVEEFREYPIMCKKDFGSVLAAGQLYTRSSAKPESSPRQTHGEMREVIALSVDKNLENFVQRARSGGLSFGDDEQLVVPDVEREQIRGAFARNGEVVNEPHFRFTIRLNPFVADRLELADLRRIATSHEVRHWGWSYPIQDAAGQGQDWVAGSSRPEHEPEAWRFYRSGLFASSVAVSTATIDPRLKLTSAQRVEGFLHVHQPVILFSLVLEFAVRLQSQIAALTNQRFKLANAPGEGVLPAPVETIVSIEACGIRDWALSGADPRRSPGGFWNLYKYSDDALVLDPIVLRRGTSVTETRPAALTAASAFFHHFGWVAATPQVLEDTQREVLNY